MEAGIHEKQSEEIHKIILRLTTIELLLEQRNSKSDEILKTVGDISQKLEKLPERFITRLEFEAYKEGVKNTSSAKFDGIKTWQAVVLGLVMLVLGVLISMNYG